MLEILSGVKGRDRNSAKIRSVTAVNLFSTLPGRLNISLRFVSCCSENKVAMMVTRRTRLQERRRRSEDLCLEQPEKRNFQTKRRLIRIG